MTTVTNPRQHDGSVLGAVAALAPGFRERIPVTEAQRDVPRESIEELRRAGMVRMFVPHEYGGLQLTVREFVEATATVAQGCPSTGWLAGQMAFASLVVAAAAREVQEAVWADGPDVVLASTAAGLRATRVPGGFRLSGRGPFTSGSSNATWFYLGAMVLEDGKPVDGRFFLMPRRDLSVEKSWNTMAMQGTGSNTVVLDDVFVPEAFGLPFAQLREGTAPGAALNTHSLYHLPWVCVVPLIYTATMLGATQAAYADLVDGLRAKRGPGGRRVAESEDLQITISLLSAKIDAAETVLHAAADRADSGIPQTLEDRARMTRTGSFVAQSLAEAMGQVLELSATGGFAESSFIQQAWRDVNLAAAHQSLSKRLAAARYGRLSLQVEDTSLAPFF